jgi:hypothetical protein
VSKANQFIPYLHVWVLFPRIGHPDPTQTREKTSPAGPSSIAPLDPRFRGDDVFCGEAADQLSSCQEIPSRDNNALDAAGPQVPAVYCFGGMVE